MNQFYAQGFIDKCAEVGIDPRRLVAIVDAFEKAADNWFTRNIVDPVSNTAKATGEGLYNTVAAPVKAVGQAGQQMYEGGKNIAQGNIGTGLGQIGGGVINMPADIAQGATEGVTQTTSGLLGDVPVLGGAVKGTGNMVNQLAGMPTGILNNTAGMVEQAGKGNLGGVASNASGVLTNTVARAGNALNAGGQAIAAPITEAGGLMTQGANAAQNQVNKSTGATPATQAVQSKQPTLPATMDAQPIANTTTPASRVNKAAPANPKSVQQPNTPPQAAPVNPTPVAAAPAQQGIGKKELASRMQNAAPTQASYNPFSQQTYLQEAPGTESNRTAPTQQESRQAKMDLLRRRAQAKMPQ